MRRFAYTGAVLALALLGLHLRLSWILTWTQVVVPSRGGWPSRVTFDPPNTGLAWEHDEYLYFVSTAVNAFHGRGFFPEYNFIQDGVYVPPPLQSLLILLVYRGAGRIVDPYWLMAGQAVLAAFMIVILAEVGRRLVSRLAGLVLAFLAAVHPDFVYWSASLMTESNYLFLLAVLLLLLVRWEEHPGAGRAAAAGLVLGVLNLQRVNALFLGPVLGLWAMATLGWRRGRGSALAFALAPLLALAPWVARNVAIYREPVLVSSNDGINFHVSNNVHLDVSRTPYWEQVYWDTPGPFLPEIERRLRNREGHLRRGVTYAGYSREYMGVAVNYVWKNPGHFLRNYARKLRNAFLQVPDATWVAVPQFDVPTRRRALHHALLLGGVLGLAVCLLSRRRALGQMAVLFAYFALMRGLFLLERHGRYNMTLQLFLMLFLACGLALVASKAWSAVRNARGTESSHP